MRLLSFSLPALSKLVLVCLMACPWAGLQAQVIINEYSAANLSRDVDDYDKYEDWIELYNNGANPVNLQGWHLSDDEDEPTLWTITANIAIAPGGYAIFWCSGRDTGLHTNFKLTQTKNSSEFILRWSDGSEDRGYSDSLVIPCQSSSLLADGRHGRSDARPYG